MDIDPKQFNQFQVEVYNRLELLHSELGELTKHVIQVKTVMFGANGDPGKLSVIDKRLDAHTRQITRIMQILWPIIGAIGLLAWLGIASVKAMLQ